MKTFKTTFTVLFALVATVLFQSCLDGEDSDNPDYVAIATTRVVASSNGGLSTYYFELDNSKTLTPVINKVKSYQAVEGQRVILQYDIESTATAGFDYGIELFNVSEILTKDVETLTTENEDEIGYDPITIVSDYSQLAVGYLNLQINFPIGSSTATVHLVENAITPPEDSEYTTLELRLNNPGSEYSSSNSSGLVSFKLGDYDPNITGKKGIKVIAKTTNEGELKEYLFTYSSTDD